MDERVLMRLLRTAASLYPKHAETSSWLRAQRVRVVEHSTASSALRWAQAHVHAPQIVYDPGRLDRAVDLLERLESALQPRPVVIVVSDSLEQGLAELGWKRSTYRVGFVRAQNLSGDLDNALDDLLLAEPELAVDVIDREREPEDDETVRFDVAALTAELASTCAWAGAHVERMGRSIEVRVGIEDPVLEGELVAGWRDPDGKSFELSFVGALPPGVDGFSVWAARNIGALDGILREPAALLSQVPDVDPRFAARFDAGFQLRPESDEGLAEAHSVAGTLASVPAAVDEVLVGVERASGRAGNVPRAAVLDHVRFFLEVWRVLARTRLLR
ncbi:MAG TPA: hypothetical protein VGO62_07430 [Myxococcota bacterium]|jgi:hypothetical protein